MKWTEHNTETSERFGVERGKVSLNRSSSGFQYQNCKSISRILMSFYKVCEVLYPLSSSTLDKF